MYHPLTEYLCDMISQWCLKFTLLLHIKQILNQINCNFIWFYIMILSYQALFRCRDHWNFQIIMQNQIKTWLIWLKIVVLEIILKFKLLLFYNSENFLFKLKLDNPKFWLSHLWVVILNYQILILINIFQGHKIARV